jgi:hypothetical protein
VTTTNIKTEIMHYIDLILQATTLPDGSRLITFSVSMPFPLEELHERFVAHEVIVTVLSQSEAAVDTDIHKDLVVIQNETDTELRSVHLIDVWTREIELKDYVVAAIRAGLPSYIDAYIALKLTSDWGIEKRNQTEKTWHLLAKENDQANFPEYYRTTLEFQMVYKKHVAVASARVQHVYVGYDATHRTDILKVEKATWAETDPWIFNEIPATYRMTTYQLMMPVKLSGRLECNDLTTLITALYSQDVTAGGNKAIASTNKHNLIMYFVVNLVDRAGTTRTFTFTNARIGPISWPEFTANANDPEPAIVEFYADAVAIS